MKTGDKFEHNFTVTEKIYAGFIDLFGDKNPLHTNADFAKSKKFSDKVMHGNILNGFISFFVGELLPVKNVIIQTQTIKFMKPVYLGDSLAFEAEIATVVEVINSFEFIFSFSNQHGVKVARGTILIGVI